MTPTSNLQQTPNDMAYQLDIEVACEGVSLPPEASLQTWLSAALDAAQADPDAEVSVCIVDEAESQALNAQYRHKDYPTNVLSFPADIPAELGIPLLGDLVICAPVVAREAAEQGKTPEAHWAHMLVHGALHLLGYDHIDDADAEEMEGLETQILTRLGFPPPYESTSTLEQQD
jgi:probable rRNA maturation factor